MTTWLLDTSVLVRLGDTLDSKYGTAVAALTVLRRRGDRLCVTPQVAVEFRAVATRPVAANGLGRTAAEADADIAYYESQFPMLPDDPAVYPAWKALVTAAGVTGKPVHDARLAAVCVVYAVPRLLTFNARHFTRFEPHVARFRAADPAEVAAGRA